MTFTQFRYYSIVHGCNVARFSVHNSHGDELFAIVPQNGRGSENRAWRTKALETLDEALATGHPAGEVRLTEEV
jgi:hypothetical protein